MPKPQREPVEQRLARCQAYTYRLVRLLAEHEIDVPPADGFVDMTAPPAGRPESPEEQCERLRLTLAAVRGRLNMFAVRTAAISWSDEARSVMRVIDRAERRV